MTDAGFEPADFAKVTGYAPVPIAPDPARDARVAARRAADVRKASAALDRLIAAGGTARSAAEVAYRYGWRDGYAASEEHHNRDYVVPDDPHAYRRSGHGAGWQLCWCGRESGDPIHTHNTPNAHYVAVPDGPGAVVPLCSHGDDADACQLSHLDRGA